MSIKVPLSPRAEKLQAILKERNITGVKFAAMVGVSQPLISAYLRGKPMGHEFARNAEKALDLAPYSLEENDSQFFEPMGYSKQYASALAVATYQLTQAHGGDFTPEGFLAVWNLVDSIAQSKNLDPDKQIAEIIDIAQFAMAHRGA